MTKKEKLAKVTENFCLLSEGKQEYILGILQALVFAHNQQSQEEQPKTVPADSEQGTVPV